MALVGLNIWHNSSIVNVTVIYCNENFQIYIDNLESSQFYVFSTFYTKWQFKVLYVHIK